MIGREEKCDNKILYIYIYIYALPTLRTSGRGCSWTKLRLLSSLEKNLTLVLGSTYFSIILKLYLKCQTRRNNIQHTKVNHEPFQILNKISIFELILFFCSCGKALWAWHNEKY